MLSRILLCLVFAVALVAAAEGEDLKTNPFLIVYKTISEKVLQVGTPLTVNVEVTNYGHSTAFDVKINDESPLDGAIHTNSVETLEFNETLKLEYTLTPAETGHLTVGPAEVTFALQAGDTTKLKAISNTPMEEEKLFGGADREDDLVRGRVDIVTSSEYERYHTRYIKEMLCYMLFAVVIVLLPYLAYRSRQSQADQLTRETRKK